LIERTLVSLDPNIHIQRLNSFRKYKVSRKSINNRFATQVTKFSSTDHVGEIAYLISGRKITEASMKLTEELLYHG